MIRQKGRYKWKGIRDIKRSQKLEEGIKTKKGRTTEGNV